MKFKTGRKRKTGVKRHACGKILKSEVQIGKARDAQETERQTRETALTARMIVHGLSAEGAAKQEAGSTLGRLLIDKKITRDQYEAGERYCETVRSYYAAIGIPQPSARAQDVLSVRGLGTDTADMQTRVQRAVNRFLHDERVLLMLPNGPRVKSTVWAVCVEDVPHLRDMHESQLRMLRAGLTALGV